MKRAIILFFFLVLPLGCVEKAKMGGEGEPCFENGTCLKGFFCDENFVCQKMEEEEEDAETLCNVDCGNSAKCVNGGCVCMYGYANCDNNWANGCETEILSNKFHCGNCLDYCGENSLCKNGKCECVSGYINEDKNWQNGCENRVELNDIVEIRTEDVKDILEDIISGDIQHFDILTDVLSDLGSGCSNFVCICGTYCEIIDDSPSCVSGCLVDKDCCEDQYCDKGNKICKKVVKICHSDQECSNNPVKKFCDIGDSFECVECISNQQCDMTKGYFCEIVSKTCQKIQDACNGSCDYTKEFCNSKTNPASCQPVNPDFCKSCSVTLSNCPSPLICQPIDPMNPFKGGTCGVECYTPEDCFGKSCDTQYKQCICQ